MPTLQHFGVGCIPWSPLAGGSESRDWRTLGAELTPQTSHGLTPRNQAQSDRSPVACP